MNTLMGILIGLLAYVLIYGLFFLLLIRQERKN